ncbi:MAG: helix-turn-helix transcriptional regulator [bacterium]|nr:helix-turn-helix transcriptional regulator [bacterium]
MRKKQKFLKQIGCNMRKIREICELSQEELAYDCKIDRSHLGKIERGEVNVSVRNLCKIASALDVQPGELLKNIDLKGIS